MLKKLLLIFNWKEYISFFLTLFFIKYSFLYKFNFKTTLNFPNFFLLTIASICIIAIGDFLIYFYSQNKPSSKVRQKKTFLFSLILLALCLISILLLFIKIGNLNIIFIYLLLIVVTIYHATKNHKKTLLNNIIISSYKPLSIIFLWYIDSPIDITYKQWQVVLQLEVIILYVVIVSFFSNLNKNILIDLKNKKKDLQKKHKTLPIVFGDKNTKKIMINMTIVCHFTTILLIALFLINIKVSYIIVALLYIHMTIHQITFYYFLKKAKQKQDYKKLINTITKTLLIGISIFPIMAYLIKNVIK